MIPHSSTLFSPKIRWGCNVMTNRPGCPFTISSSMVLIRITTFVIIAAMFFYRAYNLFLRDFMIRIYNEWFSWLVNNIESDVTDMKFGFWNTSTESIKQANESLVQFICLHANIHEISKENESFKILDLGCDKGGTTALLKKEIEKQNIKCDILAIDHKKESIEYALNHHFDSNIEFLHADPLTLSSETFGKFDLVVSLERAYCFSNRPLVFRKVASLLKPKGIFITNDFVFEAAKYKKLFKCPKMKNAGILCDNILVNMLRKSCETFFKIPECNMVNQDIWNKQLAQLFDEIESKNTTNETFVPYYNYVLSTNAKLLHGKHCQNFAINILDLLCDYQPFECVLGVFQAKKAE